jgi:hypothetical protein
MGCGPGQGVVMDLLEFLKWYVILRYLGIIGDVDPSTIDPSTISLDFIGDAIPGTINGT